MTQEQVRQDSILDLFDSTTDADADEPTLAPAGPGGRGPRGARPVDDGRRRRRLKILAVLLGLVLLATAAVAAWYLTQRKPLSQLPGSTVVAPPTYKTSFYNVDKPLGVAVTPDGSKVYVTTGAGNGGVVQLDRDGRRIRDFAWPDDQPAPHTPVYLAVASDGTVYVGDRAQGAVYLFSPDGEYRSRFAPQDASLEFSPLGVAVASDGTLYVADVKSDKPADHRILVFGRDGALLHTWGLGELNYPNQLVPDGLGNLYVADSSNGRVVLFDAQGAMTTLIARGVGEGDLGLPRGLGLDDRGRIFVVDTTDHMVRMYTRGATASDHPTYQTSFGDQGIGDGEFVFPNGLATDTRARVYITDRENNRVQVWGY